MSLIITRRPEKTVGSKTSRWTALHNPYLFEFTRKDFIVVSTAIRPAYHATLPTVQLTGGATGYVNPGEVVYLNSTLYNGPYTVEAVTVISPTLSYVVLDTPYIGVGGAGWMNVPVLENYKAYIIIYDNFDNSVIDIMYLKPDSTGLILCDVSGVIKSLIETVDTNTFQYRNEANTSLSGSFYLGYGGMFKVAETEIENIEVVDGTDYYWLSAARQVTGKTVLGMGGNGQNMAEYVMFNQAGSQKFLTMFSKPTIWVGYPNYLSFIYSEDLNTVYVERHQQNKNINGSATSSESDLNLYVTGKGYVNDMEIADVESNTTELTVWLETGGTVSDGYVVSGGIQPGSTSEYAQPITMAG